MQQSIGLLQVTEGALQQMTAIVQRMQGLAAQAASATYGDADRAAMNHEFQVLKQEVDRIAAFTTYNGIQLLDEEKELTIQAGPSEAGNDVCRIAVGDLRASSERMRIADLGLSTSGDAQHCLDALERSQDSLLEQRSRIAAFQNRLQLSATTTEGIVQAMHGSEAEIRGADMAASVSELTRSQIMAQAAASMASETATDVERVLSLLQ